MVSARHVGVPAAAAKAPFFLPTAVSGGSHKGTQHVVAVSALLAVGEGHCGFLPTVRNWPPELCSTRQGPWHALGGDWTGRKCGRPHMVGWAQTEIPASQVAEVSRQGWRKQPRQGSGQDKGPEGLQPADLALLVGQHADESHRAQGKALHKVVARQQEAKLGLCRVRQDRHAYENAWGQYLGQLTQLLEKQLLERQEALAKYDASETAWKDQLEEASAELSKHAAQPVPKESADGVQEISEDEMDTREKQIDEAIAEEAKAQQSQQQREQTAQKAAQLLEAMQQMKSALPAKASGTARDGSRTPRRSASKERENAPEGGGDTKTKEAAEPTEAAPPGAART